VRVARRYRAYRIRFKENDTIHSAVLVQARLDPVSGQIRGRVPRSLNLQGDQTAIAKENLLDCKRFSGSRRDLERINQGYLGEETIADSAIDNSPEVGRSYRISHLSNRAVHVGDVVSISGRLAQVAIQSSNNRELNGQTIFIVIVNHRWERL
jgi:hypothetical protein